MPYRPAAAKSPYFTPHFVLTFSISGGVWCLGAPKSLDILQNGWSRCESHDTCQETTHGSAMTGAAGSRLQPTFCIPQTIAEVVRQATFMQPLVSHALQDPGSDVVSPNHTIFRRPLDCHRLVATMNTAQYKLGPEARNGKLIVHDPCSRDPVITAGVMTKA
ncbi:unnamed protein product [Mycena citricolor]|uniref:Uncharacterized protein n=2 Tax=Mycena citricolor TaxID=2018698 RepID=A0AAD2Q2B1_9AGAR|nr:unnamed protein product [Mycena citricolor]